ncbi:MAG TPA: LCP family protein [Clostridia bacterium]|nr:LCP family protein [Clostridia bacterium]
MRDPNGRGNAERRSKPRKRRRESYEDEETRVYSPGVGKVERRRRKPWKMILGFVLIIVAVAALSAVLGAYNFMKTLNPGTGSLEAAQEPAPSERTNILILGIDGGVNGNGDKLGRGPKRSDTMVVVSVDPDLKKVGVLSIPRDTRVRIPGRSGYDKIAHAHAYGGPELAMKTVEEFLGVPIHYYARADFEGFAKIIDTLGGIEMDVEKDMHYEDPAQGLKINLKAGRQVLDGDKALQFVRYRQYPNGDIGRVRAQQKFFAAVIDKFFQMKTVWKLPSLASQIKECLETNMDPEDMVRLGSILARMDTNSIEMAMVPGRDAMITDKGHTLSYWVADKPELQKVVDRLLRGIDKDANSLIKVDVLNGTGVAGLARALAERLAEEGYTINSVGNFSTQDIKQTRILNHMEDSDAANSVARALRRQGIQARIYRDVKLGEEGDVKVTVVVGEDFAEKAGDGGTEDGETP